MKKLIKIFYHSIENLGSKIFFEKYFKKKVLDKIRKLANNCEQILEIGAGQNSYFHFNGRNYTITGFDIYEPSLIKAKKEGKIDQYVVGNVLNIESIFRPKSFDLVCAFDLIEHLKKEDGFKLIKSMEKIARKRIVIYTPNGFLPQPPSKDNPFQEHLSGWEYYEMKSLGFEVWGVNGYKKLRGMYALPKIKPYFVGDFISNFSMIIIKIINKEEKSFSILCSKDIKD